MLIDVLTLIAPSPQFMATNYLASTVPGQNPTITYLSSPDDDGNQELIYMKGLSGYPWDWTTVTKSWIRQRLTERVWSNPATGKVTYGLGVRRFPRWIVGGGFCEYQWSMQSRETDYIIYEADGSVSRNTDAGVRCTFRGPYAGAATGDLPAGSDWVADYEWGGKNGLYSVLESIKHRVGFGRYSWTSSPSDGKGGYLAPTAQTLQNKIMALPTGGVKPVQNIF